MFVWGLCVCVYVSVAGRQAGRPWSRSAGRVAQPLSSSSSSSLESGTMTQRAAQRLTARRVSPFLCPICARVIAKKCLSLSRHTLAPLLSPKTKNQVPDIFFNFYIRTIMDKEFLLLFFFFRNISINS